MRLEEVVQNFADQAHFACVYIREAHPQDGDMMSVNIEDSVFFNQPTTEDERAEVAAACMLRYNFSFPMLLDDMTDDAEQKYFAWPERLYVVGADGRIAYQGGMGPFFFDPDEWEGAIKAELSQIAAE